MSFVKLYFPAVWYATLAAGAYGVYRYYLYSTTGWTSFMETHDPTLDVMMACLVYVGFEAFQFFMGKFNANASQHLLTNKPMFQYEANAEAFVIVAAHKAHDSLRQILPSVMAAFPAHQIWIADNGHTQDTDTQRLCVELGLQYRFYNIPNKTYALYRTAKEIYDTHHDQARSVVLLDDDTKLNDGFFVRTDLLAEPLVAGYCVGIVIDKTAPYNLWEHMIDFEYRTISYRNGWKAEKGTIHFLHGICAVYNLKRMLMIYSKLCTMPDGLPFGEDSFAGIDCRAAGYRLLQDNMNVVTTFCPRRLLPPVCPGGGKNQGREQGYGAASLWKQRALRWYLSWVRRLPGEFALGLTYDTGNWMGNVLYRVDLLWYFFVMFVSSAWPVYMVHIGLQHKSWTMFGLLHTCLFGTTMLTSIVRYLGFPGTLKKDIHMTTFLLVPVMNVTVCVLMCASFFLSLVWYIPFYRVQYRKCYALAE